MRSRPLNSILKPKVTVIETIDDLVKKVESFDHGKQRSRWIFRGQKNSEWGLQTTFDRMYAETQGFDQNLTRLEIGLLKRFQRESHHYGISGIDLLNIPEWFSVMQHYGAPTRLLDWTHSFWVALFFAVAELPRHVDDEVSYCSVWVADWQYIDRHMPIQVKDIYAQDHNMINIEDFIKATKKSAIVKLNSYRQNQRQIIQQGTFLFPLNIEKTFEDNWTENLGDCPLLKIDISSNLKSELIQRLYRMNITYATLYPGIEGFGRSIGMLHHIPGILTVEQNISDYEGLRKKLGASNL